ncbi:hypothetical protein RKD18_002544 [Streptomyces phaeoluteigriseus]
MAEASVVEAVRTPVGRRGGGLAGVHPADLGAHVLKELVARSGIDPAAVDDVVFGCLDAVGPQAGDIARTCWLAAGSTACASQPGTARTGPRRAARRPAGPRGALRGRRPSTCRTPAPSGTTRSAPAPAPGPAP